MVQTHLFRSSFLHVVILRSIAQTMGRQFASAKVTAARTTADNVTSAVCISPSWLSTRREAVRLLTRRLGHAVLNTLLENKTHLHTIRNEVQGCRLVMPKEIGLPSRGNALGIDTLEVCVRVDIELKHDNKAYHLIVTAPV